MTSKASAPEPPVCAIERSLGVIGERWMFLILRQAHAGTERFADFEAALGVAPNILAARLDTLVRAGVMEKREYREPGQRARPSYHLTQAGIDLRLVLGAIQQWGDQYLPLIGGPVIARQNATTGKPVRVGFIDEHDRPVDLSDVSISAPIADQKP
ncbi:MAG TPA: helix-turn-helix domain-containing protein [Lacisediminihabitans sp.]|uniref:winged helix-turn-helix transcriptional regulator n=1 Tax=Lacisediminihabitans sp. TaxID=2787631 RepID=UPI002ED77B63